MQGWRHLPIPARRAAVSAKDLQRRMDAVPEWIRPAFSDFRDFVHNSAKDYQESNPRPNRKTLQHYLAGFVKIISDPLELAQSGAVAAGYYLPLPDRINRWTAGAGSATTALVGETVVWSSAFTATAGGLTVATVSEMLDVYAVASARTHRYRWARLAPGPDVVRSDVVTILDAAGSGFAKGALVQWGLEGLGELAKHAATGIIGDLAVPGVGAYKGGRRTRAALKQAVQAPLSPMPDDGPPSEPDLSAPPPVSFYDWFRREGPAGGLGLPPGGLEPA